MASTRLGYLAVKLETAIATAVKPTNFVRFKDGDINKWLTILDNNPIQNQRRNPINAVATTESSDGAYNFDLDPNDVVFFLKAGMGSMSSADISSATDGSVYRHTINMANTLPSMTIEQGKGNLSDTTQNRQKYQVDRAFWAMVDSFVMSASDGIINMEVNVLAHGVFQMARLTADATAWSNVDLSLTSVEWLTTADSVNIFDETPQNEVDAIAAIDPTLRTIEIATLGNSYTVANFAKVELVPQTPSYSTPAKVMSFRHVRFQFGDDLTAAASAAISNVENWEITYENNLEARYGSLRASPSVIGEKWATAMMTYTMYFTDVAERDKYLNLREQACIVTISNDEIVSATDTNQTPYSIIMKFNKVIIKTYEMPTGTDELYAISVEATAFYDETAWKALQVEVVNKNAWTIYA